MTTPIPTAASPASVLAAIIRADPAHPYSGTTDPRQQRRVTFAPATPPDLPSLTTDEVFMPQYAFVDANATFSGSVSTPGLPGATAASRYVGATASGAPASGTFAVGDFVLDLTGKVWICTTAGSPGAWSAGSGATNVLNGVTVSGTPTAGQVLVASSATAASWGTQGASVMLKKAVSYTLQVADSGVFADSTSGPLTMTLASAALCFDGLARTIKDWKGQSSANNITVATTASQTIDGASTVVIAANYDSYSFVSDGSNWSVV